MSGMDVARWWWMPLAGLACLLCGCVSQEVRNSLLSQRYALSVNYERTVEDSIRAGSNSWEYYRVTSANFPSGESGSATLSVVLVKVDSAAVVDEVIVNQAHAGRRPATLKELLAFGETYPEIQRKLPVIALGSSSDLLTTTFRRLYQMNLMSITTDIDRRVIRYYPYLGGELLGRTVNLSPIGTSDFETYRTFYACFVEQR